MYVDQTTRILTAAQQFMREQEVGGGKQLTEAEIQLPLKRFPDSSDSSLILAGWCEERHPAPRKLAPTFPWIDNCLMVTKRDFLEMEA